jgi:hypothetical protein
MGSHHVNDCYTEVRELIADVTGSCEDLNARLAPSPIRLSPDLVAKLRRRYEVIKEWQQITLDLLRASLSGEFEPEFASLVLNELPEYVAHDFHRRLMYLPLRTPVFFRTDEVGDGKLAEVQSPGSLWGTHEVLLDLYRHRSGQGAAQPPLSETMPASLRTYLSRPPVVHHLLEQSSHPVLERYLIEKLRREIPYFGYDAAVTPATCNFIRVHTFSSFWSDQAREQRLEALAEGRLWYDLTPGILFSEKIPMAFPFWSTTRRYYSDAVRNLFPYTQLVTPEGIELEDGSWASLEQIAALDDRNFFLKYAGADASRNYYGMSTLSLAHLSPAACQDKLGAIARADRGKEVWIMQRSCGALEQCCYLSGNSDVVEMAGYRKSSSFYGPQGFLGMLVMHAPFDNVHTTPETVLSLAV